jgi:hypothetical protein
MPALFFGLNDFHPGIISAVFANPVGYLRLLAMRTHRRCGRLKL